MVWGGFRAGVGLAWGWFKVVYDLFRIGVGLILGWLRVGVGLV